MALTPEKKVKDKVVKLLRQYGVYYFFPATHGFGRSGVPDVVCCIKGRFFAVECKAGTNTPTALQEKEIADIRKAGGIALVINETNLTMLERALLKLTGANTEENDDDGRC
jgi:Holliday junction resolvase